MSMTAPECERRSVRGTLERRVRTETSEDTLEGYAALYDSETIIGEYFREVIRPGAFREAIGRDDVRALWNHDPNYVLGRTSAKTLTLSEDEIGLRYAVVPPGTSWARDLVQSVTRGDVSQSSFAFRVTKETWVEPSEPRGLPLREIVAVELFDVSPVTYPAYQDTTVSARSMAQAMRERVPAPVVEPEAGPRVRRAKASQEWRRRTMQLRDTLSDSQRSES